ncbi:MAG: hypothetical protein SGJ21_08810 [Alphaproteobacteria bacterium]|nr:hypothetical protein [Alphaproteobacteria bacterium]
MRKDMSKVIVERPRTGGGPQRKGRTVALDSDNDTGPLRQRVVVRKPQRTKQLNENLAPLRRFLQSSVGRSWNKVHSELSDNIRPTSTVQQHVLDHVAEFVATNAFMQDGEVFVTLDRFGGEPTPVKASWALFYVHPKTGRLMKNRDQRSPPPAKVVKRDRPEDRRRDLGALRQAHLFGDGAWWDIVLEANPVRREKTRDSEKRVSTRKVALSFEDVVLAKGFSDMTAQKLYGRGDVHAVSARRLTKAERKKLDLP